MNTNDAVRLEPVSLEWALEHTQGEFRDSIREYGGQCFRVIRLEVEDR